MPGKGVIRLLYFVLRTSDRAKSFTTRSSLRQSTKCYSSRPPYRPRPPLAAPVPLHTLRAHQFSLMPQPRRSYGADYAAVPLRSSIRIRPSRVGPANLSNFRMPRRQHVTLFVLLGISAFIGFSLLMMFRSHSSSYASYIIPPSKEEIPVDNEILLGEATAPKLENATLKYFYQFDSS